MFSPRNHIELYHVMSSEIDAVDTLFEICDAEFNSRKDVHDCFDRAIGLKSWARYYLSNEVKKVAQRENIMCSDHLSLIVATELAKVWFDCKEKEITDIRKGCFSGL